MSVKERITVTVDSEIAAQLKSLAGSTSSFVEAAIRESSTASGTHGRCWTVSWRTRSAATPSGSPRRKHGSPK